MRNATGATTSQQYTDPTNKLLSRLDHVKQTGPGKWMALCPGHDDRTPSLSIRLAENEWLLVNCFAGCSFDDIIAAVGLDPRDLFPNRMPAGKHRHKPTAPRINWRELWEAIEIALIAIALAWSDFAKGKPLSPADAAFLAQRALHLAGVIREVLDAR